MEYARLFCVLNYDYDINLHIEFPNEMRMFKGVNQHEKICISCLYYGPKIVRYENTS